MLIRLYPYRVRSITAAILLLVSFGAVTDAADVYRGLWVGQGTLSFVNEVSVPLDANNVAIAPDPRLPTPTSDQAHLRLILHVNSVGQVHLLKDVAILNRLSAAVPLSSQVVNLLSPADALNSAVSLSSESDLTLVTDERLYDVFPAQPATRIASAVFDFGDRRATDAINAVVEAAKVAAAKAVHEAPRGALASVDGRKAVVTATAQKARAAAEPIVTNADVAKHFEGFLKNHLTAQAVNDLAAAPDPLQAAAVLRGEAKALQDRSFFSDSRALHMVDAVVKAVQDAVTVAQKNKAAHNVASAFADIAAAYHRFIAGKQFGRMIQVAAAAAARAAVQPGATALSIKSAVEDDSGVNDVRAEALRRKVAQYKDTRYTDAIDVVLKAIIDQAVAALPATSERETAIATDATQAGREALANQVTRLPLPSQAPTIDYNAFVRSDGFRKSATWAAQAAAEGAVLERRQHALSTLTSLEEAARVAAAEGLQSVFSEAARAVQTELPLEGNFGPGRGDVRLRADIAPDEPRLGPAGLKGTIFLPANHPTNPFRHRRHPDHRVGFDLYRHIRLDFDGHSGDSLARAGFGVDRVTGIYREEIVGLHKPLGPKRDIGLRVEGRFILHRISLIDTLNAY